MFLTLSKDYRKLQYFFEYTEIDEKSSEFIEGLHIEELVNSMPKKWCINLNRQIAFVELEYVHASIVRGNHDECFYKFLFFLHDSYGIIETYAYRDCEFLSPKVHYEKIRKPALSNEDILKLLREAIKAREKARCIYYEIDDLLRKAQQVKTTYTSLVHGKFSDELGELVNSVTEIENMDLKFRKICVDHFTEYNLGIGKPHIHGFYLYDDEQSFEIFDIILWMYLHKYTSFSKIIDDWNEISNRWFEDSFRIGGAKRYFCELYMNDRIEKKIISVENDTIKLDSDYSRKILDRLEKTIV